MFFTDPFFIAVLLPALVVLFRLAGRHSRQAQIRLLLLVSLLLYAWSSPSFLPLLLAMVLLSYLAATAIASAATRAVARTWLAGALVGNLGVLAYYKYNGAAFGAAAANKSLPLGISFVAITLVVYLVQVYRTRNRGRLTDLAFVATYFPHLAAGPILNYGEIAAELERDRRDSNQVRMELTQGITLFAMGLAKKLFVADSLAPYADFAFGFADGGVISFLFAWMGVLSYALQLYFDFSGYSDMALGASLLFGIRLPFNFDSPYKAANLVEFWRRWHMSLSRVLRDLVYIPLGGARFGEVRKFCAIIATMVLGGAWHGASANYWLWGAYHGILLCVVHWYMARGDRPRVPSVQRWLGRAATLLAVMIGWVIFRSTSMQSLLVMLRGISGQTGLYMAALPTASSQSAGLSMPEFVSFTAKGLSLPEFAVLITVFGWVALRAPNTNQLTALTPGQPRWSASWRWGLRTGGLFALALGSLLADRKFLYVNF